MTCAFDRRNVGQRKVADRATHISPGRGFRTSIGRSTITSQITTGSIKSRYNYTPAHGPISHLTSFPAHPARPGRVLCEMRINMVVECNLIRVLLLLTDWTACHLGVVVMAPSSRWRVGCEQRGSLHSISPFVALGHRSRFTPHQQSSDFISSVISGLYPSHKAG